MVAKGAVSGHSPVSLWKTLFAALLLCAMMREIGGECNAKMLRTQWLMQLLATNRATLPAVLRDVNRLAFLALRYIELLEGRGRDYQSVRESLLVAPYPFE